MRETLQPNALRGRGLNHGPIKDIMEIPWKKCNVVWELDSINVCIIITRENAPVRINVLGDNRTLCLTVNSSQIVQKNNSHKYAKKT